MLFFFFQAEDGIRDKLVTGVQTCALPITAAATAMQAEQAVAVAVATRTATAAAAAATSAAPGAPPASWPRSSSRRSPRSARSAAGGAAGRAADRVRVSRSSSIEARVAVGGRHQGASDGGIERAVTCVRHDHELRLGPGAVEVPGIADRADHVVAAVHDRARDVPNPGDVAQELVVAVQEAAVGEVVALDARQSQRARILGELRREVRVGHELEETALPSAPGPGRRQ